MPVDFGVSAVLPSKDKEVEASHPFLEEQSTMLLENSHSQMHNISTDESWVIRDDLPRGLLVSGSPMPCS